MTADKPTTSDPDMDGGPVDPANERDMQGVLTGTVCVSGWEHPDTQSVPPAGEVAELKHQAIDHGLFEVADALSALEKERDELKDDLVRYINIANEHMNEADRLIANSEWHMRGKSELRDEVEGLEGSVASWKDVYDTDIKALRAQRDRLTEELERLKAEVRTLRNIAVRLDKEVERLRKALEAIASGSWNTTEHNPTGAYRTVHEFASAALSSTQGDGE